MSKEDNGILKAILDYVCTFLESKGNKYTYHDFRYANDCVIYGRAIAKAEDISKEEYEPGIAAVILSNLGTTNGNNNDVDNTIIVNNFLNDYYLSDKGKREIVNHVEFLHSKKPPRSVIEMVLRDCRDIHLGLPDALERIDLMRPELEHQENKKFNDFEWEEFCREYFITHTFYTRYASEKFGITRSKNFVELERRIEKFEIEIEKEKEKEKEKKGNIKNSDESILSDKESEDLFKIAFRNYLNLVILADRKAHLLIEVNSLLASAIIAFALKKVQEEEHKLYIIPISIVLLVAGLTIFFAILASKPLKKFLDFDRSDKQPFFFGSFDRLDPDFKKVTWEKYSNDISELFIGDKKLVFDSLIKESFQVRKVLSKKFEYLSIAYKIFITGQILGILAFLAIMFYYYNMPAAQSVSPL